MEQADQVVRSRTSRRQCSFCILLSDWFFFLASDWLMDTGYCHLIGEIILSFDWLNTFNRFCQQKSTLKQQQPYTFIPEQWCVSTTTTTTTTTTIIIITTTTTTTTNTTTTTTTAAAVCRAIYTATTIESSQ